MESKKSDNDKKTLKKSSYNNRKECIKKKTMELSTLCGIDACTIMYGPDGDIESWPENPTQAKAIIKKFKDLTSNPSKRTTVRDESLKKAIHVPGGEVVPCQGSTKTEPDGEIVNLAKMLEKSSLYLRRSSLSGYQECLKQVDSKLEALIKRMEFLRRDQESDMTCSCIETKQLDYSEKNTRWYSPDKTSPKRRKVSQAPEVFPFDLNYPPPDRPECSSLSFEV